MCRQIREAPGGLHFNQDVRLKNEKKTCSTFILVISINKYHSYTSLQTSSRDTSTINIVSALRFMYTAKCSHTILAQFASLGGLRRKITGSNKEGA